MSYKLKVETWGDSREELIKQVKDFLREAETYEDSYTTHLGFIGSDPLDTPEARDLEAFWSDIFFQALGGFCSNSSELSCSEFELAQRVANYAVTHYDDMVERRDAAILAALEVK